MSSNCTTQPVVCVPEIVLSPPASPEVGLIGSATLTKPTRKIHCTELEGLKTNPASSNFYELQDFRMHPKKQLYLEKDLKSSALSEENTQALPNENIISNNSLQKRQAFCKCCGPTCNLLADVVVLIFSILFTLNLVWQLDSAFCILTLVFLGLVLMFSGAVIGYRCKSKRESIGVVKMYMWARIAIFLCLIIIFIVHWISIHEDIVKREDIEKQLASSVHSSSQSSPPSPGQLTSQSVSSDRQTLQISANARKAFIPALVFLIGSYIILIASTYCLRREIAIEQIGINVRHDQLGRGSGKLRLGPKGLTNHPI